MSVMRGACVRRARLQATDGAPMPTKHTSSFFSTRAAATAIISAVEYSMDPPLCIWYIGVPIPRKHMLSHPVEKCRAIPRNRVPGGIGRVGAAWHLDNGAYRPVRQDRGVWTWNAQVIDDFFYGDDHTGCRERSLLLDANDPFDEHVPCAIRPLRVNDGEVRSKGRNGGESFAGERAFDKPDTRVDSYKIRALIASEDGARQP